MRGWILYRSSEEEIRPEAYEIHRFQDEAEAAGIQVRVFKPEQFELLVTRDDRKSVMVDGRVEPLPDFLLPRMGAGTTYFALAVIRHLERLGVQAFNGSEAVEKVKDKLYTQQILAASNLPFAKTMLVRFPVDLDLIEKHLGFPVIVKTVSGSQGTGVFLSEDRSSLEDLMNLIRTSKGSVNIILQEYVECSRGRDLRVFTVGGRAIAAMQRVAQEGQFKANYSRGATVTPYELTPEIEWLAAETSRILDLDIAGIDLLFDGDHFKICEANSSPGFEGMESCQDLSIPAQIYDYVRIRLGQVE